MNSRTDFHSELCAQQGTNYIYFDPPENIQMHYPCIRYQIAKDSIKRANNKLYFSSVGYELIVINKDQDAGMTLVKKILGHFMLSTFNRHYISDGLHHFVLTIFY